MGCNKAHRKAQEAKEPQAKANTVHPKTVDPKIKPSENPEKTVDHKTVSTPADKPPLNASNELKTQEKNIQQEPNIQPIKEFGTNYPEFYHDGLGAIQKLLRERQGQVAGAFYRKELGDIDLVWGQVTDPKNHKGYGLAHIIDKHGDLDLFKIPEVIKNGEVIDLGNGKVRIVAENYSVGMKKEWKGQEKNPYILTAFENTKESAKNLHSNTFTKGETLPLNSQTDSTITPKTTQEIIKEGKEAGKSGKESLLIKIKTRSLPIKRIQIILCGLA